ncbi:MAG: tetratricopeptide repeat protein [Phycisphaeraceae bacterium]|nr:tetratricopeptide repeat protein [Phycisphaeraceae bacterium]
MGERRARRLLIVGWDAADWKLIDPLVKAGRMPALGGLIEAGVRADLRSLDPKLSPLLWTSIATGKTADKHGILHFLEPDPHGGGLRPACSTSRRTKALWNMLTQSSMRVHVVGWYATHPAEPIGGSMISNLFLEQMPEEPGGAWPLLPGSVHPAAMADPIGDVRLHPAEISAEEMRLLVPELGSLRPGDPRGRLLARLLAQTASVHNAATLLMEHDPAWDCMMVFYESIDVVGHHFMQYYPPRMPHVPPADFELFKDVMPGIYEVQDAMLGRLLELAGPETTVMVLSDHGFHSDHLRPKVQAAVDDPHAAMDATWHRPHGVLVISGPGVVKGAGVYGAGLLDVAPTALTLLGLPVGADMDGRVLLEALSGEVKIERLFSWDDTDGDAGMHPADVRVDPFEARDAMRQLADLGYISELSAHEADHASLCDRETRFNLGVVYMSTGRTGEASKVFERLHAEHPDEPRYAMNTAHCRYATGRHSEAVDILERLADRHPAIADAQLLRGAALFAQGRIDEAAEALEAAVRQSPDRPDLLCTIAGAYTHLKRFDEAEQVLGRAAHIDPHDPMVPYRRAELHLARGQFEDAAEQALTAVELRHFFPEAHYTLGVALTWIKDYPHAIQSFKVALSMQPGLLNAHRFIASIYRHLGDRASARPHREAAERMLAASRAGVEAPITMVEPPMGPQAWAREMGIGDDA